MAGLDLRLLGGCEGSFDDQRPLTLPTKKAWALLAYLALNPCRQVSRERLAALLWSDRSGNQARGSLRQTIYEIRVALGDDLAAMLTSDRDALGIDGALGVDVSRFEECAALTRPEDWREALDLYRGTFLEGFDVGAAEGFDEWVTTERTRLQEIACRVMEQTATFGLQQGQAQAAIETARRLVEIDPLRENGHRLLMQALAAQGRRSEALQQYRKLEDLLQGELNVAPDPATTQLRADLLRDDFLAPSRPSARSEPDTEGLANAVAAKPSRARPWRMPALAAAALAVVAAAGLGVWQPWAPEFEPASLERMAYPLPDRPSIAVLPFDNLSGDAELGYFSAGLTEDLITALSKVRRLFVISRNSTSTYQGKPVKVQQVAEDLGVRYVLEGGIQRVGEKLRITAQLIDAISGAHIWAENYDRNSSDLFDLQDEIVKKILIELQVKLTSGEHARIASRGTDNLEAWLLRVRGLEEGFNFTREGFIRARELFQAARRADPQWSRPLAGIAWTHEWEARRGWSNSKEVSIRTGMELAQEAIEMDPNDPLGYMILGNLHFASGNYERAIALRQAAVDLAPNDFNATVGFAALLWRGGQAQKALELFALAKRLSPRYPWWVLYGEGISLHLVGRYEEAIQTLKESIRRNPRYANTHALLAAVFADLDRYGEAKEEIETALELSPKMTVKSFKPVTEFQDTKTADWHGGLLRKAGLPD